MSRTYREFGDLLNAYNNADNEWMPIQKAYELLDSVNENEIWEQRHAAADALFKYIAELEAEVTKCHELQDSYCDRIAELEAEQRWIPVSERLPEVGKVVHVIDMNDTGGHLCNLYETAMLVEVSGNKRFGFIGHSGWDTSDVTHWMYAMPLPTPPEVQE